MTETLGKYLVACRQKKGLAVEEVAQITKINPRLIYAAEKDKFDELPGKVFIKGFLRSYAKVVDADGSDFIERFESLGLVDKDNSPKLISLPLHEDSTRTSVMMLFAAIIVSVVIVGFYLFGSRLYTDPLLGAQSETAMSASAIEMSAVATEPQTAPAITDDADAVEQADGNPEQAVDDAAKTVETKTGQAEKPETITGVETATTVSDEFPYRLKIMAESDSWIKVVIDDGSAKEIILRGGNSVTWMAQSKYIISIGNVAGTRIFLNGKEKKLRRPSSNVLIDIVLPSADSDEMENVQ